MEGYRIDRRQMKLDAKGAMREHKPSIFLITIVFLLIIFVLDSLDAKLQFPGMSMREINRIYFDPEAAMFAAKNAVQNQTTAGRLLGCAITIMSLFLTGGFELVCLNVARREAAGVGTLFDLFNYFFRYLWLNILMGIFIFLWTLLLVIPGIIAAYRYSMAVYIFMDDPEKGALQCIRESKEMTRGYKGQLFVLDLSFIGWAILSIIPLVSIFTRPYMLVTRANYYRFLSGGFYGQQQYYGEPWNR